MNTLRHVVSTVALCAAASAASATIVYDGSLGTSIPAQGYLGYGELFGPASITVAGGKTRVSTLANAATSAGFASDILVGFTPTRVNPGFPVLDADGDGFTVRFDLRVLAESLLSSARAGISVTVVSSSTGRAIELGFQKTSIFTQNGGLSPNLFTRGESVAFDTTLGTVRYDLAVLGSSYTLYADNAAILTGSLRDYTAFTTPSPLNPYRTASFLSFTDNTTSAAGDWELSFAEVLPQAIPSPAGAGLGVAGLLALGRRRRQG